MTQSTGAVEYTDCRGKTPLISVPDMTLNNLMVSFREYRVPFYYYRSQIYSGLVC